MRSSASIRAVSLLCVLALSACPKPAPPDAPSDPVVDTTPPPEQEVAPAPAIPVPSDPALPALDRYPVEVQRLAHVARLWGAVRYLHPYLAYRDIDWDAAGIAAISAVSTAADDAAFLDAVRAMLGVLGDPATRVSGDAGDSETPPRPITHRSTDAGVVIVDMGTANSMESYYAMLQLGPALSGASAVIFDLRDVGPDSWLEWIFPDVGPSLISARIELPAERGVVHSGYRPASGTTSGGYFSGFTTSAAVTVEPKSDTPPGRVVFLVGEALVVPSLAVAMQAAGQAQIVAPTKTIDAESLGMVTTISLGEAGNAAVRTTEPVLHGKAMAVTADATYKDDGMAVAEALVKKPLKRVAGAKLAELPSARWTPDADYADEALPGRELRILGAFRLWNVIDRFYPYHHLIGDWDAVLPYAITELAAADSPEAYARAVVKVSTHIADTHTHVRGGVTRDVIGRASPLGAGIIEGQAVVLEPDDAAVAAGVAAGDVIESIGGVPIAEAIAAAWPFVTGSTEVVRMHDALYMALRGPVDSTVELGLRTADGEKTVTLTRPQPVWPPPESDTAPYRVLASGLGYVDLRLLTVEQVDAMFEALRDTPAIIFDMRGYPNGTAWSIAPRLDRSGTPTVGATFQRCLVSGLDGGERARYLFEQHIPVSDDWKYTGRTYMLINQDTISQAEHTGLFFEAANGTEFIGTNTSGANGDVTNLVLPGGIYVGFTGHDVRHADGRQLQRLGLEPHLRVAPTIAGLRAGEDEVLDAAETYALARVGSD